VRSLNPEVVALKADAHPADRGLASSSRGKRTRGRERHARSSRGGFGAPFTGEYESSSASLAERDARVLIDWLRGGAEPAVVSNFDFDPERWRAVTAKQQGLYRATIALMLSQHPLDFHTAAPLTLEVIRAAQVDDHHVFPRAYLRESGRGAELIPFSTTPSSIAKPTSASASVHRSEYLDEIQASVGQNAVKILTSQQLPAGPNSPLTSNDFDAFLAWRVDALAELLQEAAGRVGTHSHAHSPLTSAGSAHELNR
jgi:hypothetical protein